MPWRFVKISAFVFSSRWTAGVKWNPFRNFSKSWILHLSFFCLRESGPKNCPVLLRCRNGRRERRKKKRCGSISSALIKRNSISFSDFPCLTPSISIQRGGNCSLTVTNASDVSKHAPLFPCSTTRQCWHNFSHKHMNIM